VECVYLTGYTPYPEVSNDSRLPHVAERAQKQIEKTALGAEDKIRWKHETNVMSLIFELKEQGFLVAALENTDKAMDLPGFKNKARVALIVGSEIGGIKRQLLDNADIHLAIPMLGGKESFNVAVAAAIALYHLRWYNH
jgi:23S rRNA (guanosine2251-2'-O)-methyltransferase